MHAADVPGLADVEDDPEQRVRGVEVRRPAEPRGQMPQLALPADPAATGVA